MIEGAPPRWGRWTVGRAALVFLAGFVGATIGVLVAGVDPTDIEVIGFGLGGQALGMTTALVLLSRSRGSGDVLADFGIRVRPRDSWTIGLGLGLQIVSILIVATVAAVFGVEPTEQEVVGLVENSGDGPARLLAIMLIAIALPVLEEILFRGMLLDAMRATMSDRGAIVAGAAVFALIHLLDPAAVFAIPGLFLLGLVAGYFAVKDGHLSRAILTHAGVNLTGALLIFAG